MSSRIVSNLFFVAYYTIEFNEKEKSLTKKDVVTLFPLSTRRSFITLWYFYINFVFNFFESESILFMAAIDCNKNLIIRSDIPGLITKEFKRSFLYEKLSIVF